MKSFTKVALLAATLSTVAVPVCSAMDFETESDSNAGVYALVTGAGLVATYYLYKVVGSVFFGKKARAIKPVKADNADNIVSFCSAMEFEEESDSIVVGCALTTGVGLYAIYKWGFGKAAKPVKADNVAKVKNLFDENPEIVLSARNCYLKGEKEFNDVFKKYDVTYNDYFAYINKYNPVWAATSKSYIRGD